MQWCTRGCGSKGTLCGSPGESCSCSVRGSLAFVESRAIPLGGGRTRESSPTIKVSYPGQRVLMPEMCCTRDWNDMGHVHVWAPLQNPEYCGGPYFGHDRRPTFRHDLLHPDTTYYIQTRPHYIRSPYPNYMIRTRPTTSGHDHTTSGHDHTTSGHDLLHSDKTLDHTTFGHDLRSDSTHSILSQPFS